MSREFDGVNDEIDYGSAAVLDDLAVGGAFSVHLLYNADTVGENSTGRVVQKRQSEVAGGWLFFSDATASLGFQTVDAAGAAEAQQRGADNACPLNAWHSVVLTYDDGGDRKGHIYVDGVEIAYDTDTAASGANGTDAGGSLLIGNNIAGSRTFDGEQAEHAIWNRVLTAEEILSLSLGFSPLFFGDGLVLYAPLVRDVDDVKGNGGTASGTVVTEHPSPIYYPAPSSVVVSLFSYVPDVFGDHDSDDPVRGDFGAGPPTHAAPIGSFYWDTVGNVLYVNDDGTGGGWVATGGGGYTDAEAIAAVEGEATLDLTGSVTIAGTLEVGAVQAYTESNVTTDRSYDADVTSLDEIADVLGTLIADLRAVGIIN